MVKNDFLTYQAQTSPYPLSIEVKKAKGSYIYDSNGLNCSWFNYLGTTRYLLEI